MKSLKNLILEDDKLTNLILEQGVLDSLRSIVSPIQAAISQFSLPDEDEGDALDKEQAADWDEIKNKMNAFFTEFPEVAPKNDEELKSFEKWLSKNKNNLAPGNVLEKMSQAFLKTDVNFSRQVHKYLAKIYEGYKEIFKGADTKAFKGILRRALAESRGDVNKAKEFFVNFIAKNIDKINRSRFRGEDPFDAVSKDLASRLEMNEDAIKQKLMSYAGRDTLGDQETGEELKSPERIHQWVYNVLQLYSKLKPSKEQIEEKIAQAVQSEYTDPRQYILQLLLLNDEELRKIASEKPNPQHKDTYEKLTKALDYENVNKLVTALKKANEENVGTSGENKSASGVERAKQEIVKTIIQTQTTKDYKPNEEEVKKAVDEIVNKELAGKEFNMETDFDELRKKVLSSGILGKFGPIK